MPTLTTFNIVLEAIDTANRKQKEIKGIQIGKKKKNVKLSLLLDDKILYIQNSDYSTKKLLKIMDKEDLVYIYNGMLLGN